MSRSRSAPEPLALDLAGAAGGEALVGDLRKMPARLAAPVEYALAVGAERVALNPRLGAVLRIRFTGRIRCVACGRETARSHAQGYCYACSRTLARCDRCIVDPVRCHHHLGTCREPQWGLANCMREHVVYLALTSGPKVGITRASNVPVRWIDQGAVAALPVLRTPSRRHAGHVEAALRRHVSDRTDWRAMLRGDPPPEDLAARADALLAAAREDLEAAGAKLGWTPPAREPATATAIGYPVRAHPARVRALTAERRPTIEGTLLGVKGQYLLLDTGVVNVRRHTGYEVELRI